MSPDKTALGYNISNKQSTFTVILRVHNLQLHQNICNKKKLLQENTIFHH